MPTLDERVAYLEGRLEEQNKRFDVKFDGLEAKFDRLDAKVDRLDARVDRLDSKLDGIAQRLDARIDVLDGRASRHFTWLVGIQVASSDRNCLGVVALVAVHHYFAGCDDGGTMPLMRKYVTRLP